MAENSFEVFPAQCLYCFLKSFFDDSGGDSQQEGLAGYRLGCAYEEIGDAETAILVSANLSTRPT